MKKVFRFLYIFLLGTFFSGTIKAELRTNTRPVAPVVNVTVASSGDSSGGSSTGGVVSDGSNTLASGSGETGTVDTAVTAESIGSSGLALSEGNNQLTESVSFSDSTDPIRITENNTTLDMEGRTLTYTGSDNICGITIAAGVKNVLIKNGTIDGFKGAGICVNGTSGSAVKNIRIRNVSITNCYQGIVETYVYSGDIINCKITDSADTRANTNTHAIKITNCKNISITGCSTYNNTSAAEKLYSYYIESSEDCLIKGCSAKGNNGYKDTVGFYFFNGTESNIIKECVALNNISTTENCYGIACSGSTKMFIEKCETSNNRASAGAKNSYGVALLSTNNSIIKNNTSEQNEYGFYDDEVSGSQTNIFFSNKANLNSTTGFHRPNSAPIHFLSISSGHLQNGLTVSPLDNVEISL